MTPWVGFGASIICTSFNPLITTLPQGAAGAFQLLQEQVFAHLQRAPTPDLSAEATTALQQLMLAQAQESFCIKACKGKGIQWSLL